MTYSKLHAAAREYAENGWPIFPIRPNDKRPWEGSNGFKDATLDLEQIDKWWSAVPDANIGFEPDRIGLCVIDEDTDKGGEHIDVGPPVVKTPHGRHFYYAGSLPPSSSKLAPHVDTRGRDSYVLLPPSTLSDGLLRYEWITPQPTGAWDCPELDPRVAEVCATDAIARNRVEAIKTEATDRPQAIKKFREYLEVRDFVEGAGSDDATFRAIARGLDLGLSGDTVIDLMAEYSGFDQDWLEEKLSHVEAYQQNEPGCDTPLTATEAHAGLIARAGQSQASETLPPPGTPERAAALEANGWVPHAPRDPAHMPALEFWDEDHLIPKSPQGAVGILYGKRGDHKTNTILSLLSGSKAANILYAAGEGAYGVERDRISARPDLHGRIRILPRVPLFGLPDQIVSFIEGCNSIGYKPDVVVIDTMATALAGQDEQLALTAGMLTDNGPVGDIKRAWNCTVILIAHAGKDATRGVRGSSAFEGNVDFVILCEADKKHGAIETKLVKMRDGYDGFSVYWKYEIGPEIVPIPVPIDEQTYVEMTADAPRDETTPIGLVVRSYLHLHGHHDWVTGILVADLARELTEQEHGPRPSDLDDAALWDTSKNKWRKSLHNLKNKSWAKECHDEQVCPGGDEMILRWFCPPQDQSQEV